MGATSIRGTRWRARSCKRSSLYRRRIAMQRLLQMVLLSSILAAPAWAQSSAGAKLLVIAPLRDGPPSSSVALVRRADFVTFDVTITSSESELANRVKAITETRTLVTDALAKDRVRFETGTTYLVLDQPAGETK